MTARRPLGVAIGSLAFLVVAPGTVAGLVPWWLTGWRVERPFLGLAALRIFGGAMVVVGLLGLLESSARFAFVGRGTPAPVAPPERLVVSGQYRHVRYPMYVAILAAVVGQGLLLGSGALLRYAGLLWVLFHAFVVLHEEPTLRSRFGGAYAEYTRHVRRWWPRVRAWRGDAGGGLE